jgi:hypothetical protein
MKAVWLRKLSVLALSSTLLLGLSGTAMADNNPYVKTFGADVRTGGWFDNGNNACGTSSSSNYQDNNFYNVDFPTDSNTVNAGGILTYAKQDSAGSPQGGSSSQYAAFSLGAINGSNALDNKGFYSGGVLTSTKNILSFANTDVTYPWGGVFEAGIRNLTSCIPDYYSQINSESPTGLPGNARGILSSGGTAQNGAYTATAPAGAPLDFVSGNADLNLSPQKRVDIFVNGNVYIHNNIIYDSSATVDQVPKFRLVVKGSIYVDPSVTRLDGFYVAQPIDDTSASIKNDTGIFWTCHDNTNAKQDYTFAATGGCHTNQLVMNGGVVAKQINLMRTVGDINSASRSEDTGGSLANVGEVINYTFAMIVNGSFNKTGSALGSSLPIDSLYSLPPAF